MTPLTLFCAYLSDLLLGDPEGFPHPVRGIGKLIGFFDNRLRGKGSGRIERLKGAFAALSVIGISAFAAYAVIKFSYSLNPFLGGLAWIYFGYTTLSVKDLAMKANAVFNEIKAGSLIMARERLSLMVGRDTKNLPEEKIVTATVESIAESINDGIVAPLVYLVLGGPVAAIAYKAANTLDSMIGYKNEKYMHFGWFSAKLDDVLNFIPSRIAGILIGIASRAEGALAMTESFKIMRRDGRKHPSPNSGITEAAMAGALGTRLGGPSEYNGKLLAKPYLGEDKGEIKPELIKKALKISFVVSFFMVTIGMLLKWLI